MTTRVLRALLVAAVLVQGWWAVRDVRYDRALRHGMAAYEAADVDAVRDAFRRAAAIDDRDPYLWAWAGDAAMYVFDYHSEGVAIDPAFGRELLDEAWAGYAASVARSPAYAWSWTGLSGVATRRARLDAARAGLDLARFGRLSQGIWDPFRAIGLAAGETARALNPDGFLELDVLADVYASAGDRARAAGLLRESAAIMPAPSFHPWGVGRRLDPGLYGTVLEALREGAARAPSFERSMLHLEIGRFARGQGDFGSALEEFRNAESSAESSFRRYQALWEAATVLERQGAYDRAIEATEAILGDRLLDPRRHGSSIAACRRRLAGLYRIAGRFEDACREYTAFGARDDDSDAWRIAGAISCERAGEVEQAVRLLETGLRDPASQIDLARALVDLYVRTGRMRVARLLLDRWIQDETGPAAERFREWAAAIEAASPGNRSGGS